MNKKLLPALLSIGISACAASPESQDRDANQQCVETISDATVEGIINESHSQVSETDTRLGVKYAAAIIDQYGFQCEGEVLDLTERIGASCIKKDLVDKVLEKECKGIVYDLSYYISQQAAMILYVRTGGDVNASETYTLEIDFSSGEHVCSFTIDPEECYWENTAGSQSYEL